MLHYAHTKQCASGCRNPGHFDFQHMPFAPPYGPLDYVDGTRQALNEGATVVVIDSASDMHEGIGGVLDQYEQYMHEKCGEDQGKRDKWNARAWNHVKGPLKNAILSLMQLNTILIFCFRARDKNDWGNKVVPLGTMAIADDSLIFSMTAQALLRPGAEGVPTWDPPEKGEKVQTKRGPFKDLIAGIRGPMNEEMGAIMARWAMGDAAEGATPSTVAPVAQTLTVAPSATPEPQTELEAVLESIVSAQDTGTVASIAAANRTRAGDDEQRKIIGNAIRLKNKELQR